MVNPPRYLWAAGFGCAVLDHVHLGGVLQVVPRIEAGPIPNYMPVGRITNAIMRPVVTHRDDLRAFVGCRGFSVFI